MSRIGKTPIDVPKAVTVDVASDLVTVKGPKGERKLPLRSEIKVALDGSTLTVDTNASTRFADGGELGLGAEIGISTSKLHAYGPMGANELTTRKFVVLGEGQIRV